MTQEWAQLSRKFPAHMTHYIEYTAFILHYIIGSI